MVSKRGIFVTLYVDRAGVYGGPKRCHFSQVQRACEELGIEIIYANSPEGKGRVERSFDTLQDRLVAELRLEGITQMSAANDYLKNQFIPEYWNKQVVVVPESKESEYKAVGKDIVVDEVFVQKEYRKVRRDHTFSFNNTFYSIESNLDFSLVKQQIELRVYSANCFKVFFSGEQLQVKEVVRATKRGLYELETQDKVVPVKDGNVKEAQVSDVSGQLIHEGGMTLEKQGATALEKTFNSSRRHWNRVSEEFEKKVVGFSIDNPHLGQTRVSRHLKEHCQINVSSSGVRNIWLRYEMQTVKLRIEKKDQKLAFLKAG